MLSTNSFLEHYLTLLAWIINNGIYGVLVDVSLAAWPVAAVIFSEWLRVRGEGADEGNKAVLAVHRIENKLYVAYLVVLFAFVPTIPLTLNDIQYDDKRYKECNRTGVAVPEKPADSNAGKKLETAHQVFEDNIGGKTAMIPVWWALVHSLSKGVTQAAIATIPCSPDIHTMVMALNDARIDDTNLLAELANFSRDCYGAARYRLNHNNPTLDKETNFDTGWIGSHFFLTEPGYYDSIYSQSPLADWPWNESRDSGRGQADNGGGYPTCAEWWGDPGKGLRDRVLGQLDRSLLEGFVDLIQQRTPDEVKDAMIRRVTSPEQMKRNMPSSQVQTTYAWNANSSTVAKGVGNAATNVSLAMEMPGFITSQNAIRSSLPSIQAIIIMAIIICIPLLLVMGGYQLTTVMNITFGLFAVFFCSFWWELARWLDSSIYDALYGDVALSDDILMWLPITGPFMDEPIAKVGLGYAVAAMFFVAPVLFFTMMAWAGNKAGAALQGAITAGGASAAGIAGGRTANSAMNKLGGNAMSSSSRMLRGNKKKF